MLFDPLFQAPLAVIEPPVDQDAFGIEQQAERRGELSVAPAIGRMALNLHVRFAYDPARPTLRYLDRPYVPSRAGMERPTTTLTDFFLLSGGIRVLSVETLPLGFRSSDHDPVLLWIAWEREADARR